MTKQKLTCPACSCFCDDIEVDIIDGRIKSIDNACLKGSSLIFRTEEKNERTSCMIQGLDAEPEQAIDEAAKILLNSKNPILFGFDHSTTEAQLAGIELAQEIGGKIDDFSSFSYGNIIEELINKTIPTCCISEMDSVNLFVYWGANPLHSHPRHLSNFSYYASSGYSEISTFRTVDLCTIDIRKNETALMSNPFYRLPPGDDAHFASSVCKGLTNNEDNKKAKDFYTLLNASSSTVIFVGTGLLASMGKEISPLREMIDHLALNIKIVPMVDQPNMRGFNKTLHGITGSVNMVDFAENTSKNEKIPFFQNIIDKKVDAILIIGADPFYKMPLQVLKHLDQIPIITVDPFITDTTKASKVVIGSSVSGVESEGNVIRMDGKEIHLPAPCPTNRLSDVQILKLILEKVKA